MARPPQSELHGMGTTPREPHQPADLDGPPPSGRVPVDQQPGHHPDTEQDRPDLDDFAERLGVSHDDTSSTDGDRGEHDGAAGSVVDTARSLVDRVQSVAAPVGHALGERIGQVTGAIGEYRSLSERVERLEERVAELEAEQADS